MSFCLRTICSLHQLIFFLLNSFCVSVCLDGIFIQDALWELKNILLETLPGGILRRPFFTAGSC